MKEIKCKICSEPIPPSYRNGQHGWGEELCELCDKGDELVV